VVVTSRIVGYDEAPLTGRQWRTHTLTDFTRADIEQFVTQWTLAFLRSIQGDTDATRQAAARERHDLLQAIFGNPSVERLAANPLLLTILALIKHTGVTLPEQRVKLYELYLQTLLESWNLARSLDQYPVGDRLQYEETVQVLAPLALWLRQENPTAGLVTHDQLEQWLTDYYHGAEAASGRGASARADVSRQRVAVLEPAPGARRAPVWLLAPDPGRNACRAGDCAASG
jgi:predicted NACHT family NTPase